MSETRLFVQRCVVSLPPMHLQRRHSRGLGDFDFDGVILAVLDLILRVVAQHVLIAEFDGDSRRHTGQIARYRRGERAAARLGGDFR
jgi:hypothetical protein